MRVIYLCQHFPPETGAPQIRVYEVSKELIKRGHQVEVITAFPHHPTGIIPEEYRGKFYLFEKWNEIPVHVLGYIRLQKGAFGKDYFPIFLLLLVLFILFLSLNQRMSLYAILPLSFWE